jgi:type VI secretion system secreted protein Hcp
MRTHHVHLRARARVAVAAAAGVVLLGVAPGTAAADSAFLRLDGIPGESTSARFENQIDVTAFTWGITTSNSPAGGGGAGTGRTTFDDLAVIKAVDAASPPLFAAAAAGRHVSDATLTVVTSGANPAAYLRYCLHDLTVASVKQDEARAERPVETVTFRYGQFAMAYGRQAPDGTRTFVTQGWDLIGNLATTEAC